MGAGKYRITSKFCEYSHAAAGGGREKEGTPIFRSQGLGLATENFGPTPEQRLWGPET